MAEEEAHRLSRRPVGFVNGARPDVFRFEGFDQMAELCVRGVARVGKRLRGHVNDVHVTLKWQAHLLYGWEDLCCGLSYLFPVQSAIP
jgi:hypothetical protein